MVAGLKRLVVVLLVAGCTIQSRSASSGQAAPPDSAAVAAVAPVQLVDSTIPPAVAGQEGWNYRQTAEADLTRDGVAERVVLTARVELIRGRPAWDDGQPWQVYVESSDGSRTYLYAQRLQLGSLALRVGLDSAGQASTIVLLEHLPDRLSLYEVMYHRPGTASMVTRFQRNLDPRGETASPRLP
jgi:hypothetical protein